MESHGSENLYARGSRQVRSTRGSSLAEMGPILWIAFFMLLIPMICLATFGMRYAFLLNAARMSANAAAQCKTFQSDVSTADPSSVTLANTIATNAAKGFNGITLSKIKTYIVVCPFSGGQATRQTTPLTAAAVTTSNSYNMEVVLEGQLQPLISNSKGWFGTIPGLTAPITTSARADCVFENAQGLTL